MFVLLPLFILIYLFFSIYFAFVKRKTGLGKAFLFSLIAYILSIILGSILIFSSRGSTSALGFIFLPFYSLIPGILAFGLILLKPKVLKMIMGIMIIIYYSFLIHLIINIKIKNYNSDLAQQTHELEIQKHRSWIKSMEAMPPQEALQILTQKINESKDRTLLITIAESPILTTEILDTLSKNEDLGVVITVIRNKNTSAATLENIFKKHPMPEYFYNDLSRNERTPQEILLKLYEQKKINHGIEPGLAQNRNIPETLILKILEESKDPLALGELGRNPSIPSKSSKSLYEQ